MFLETHRKSHIKQNRLVETVQIFVYGSNENQLHMPIMRLKHKFNKYAKNF